MAAYGVQKLRQLVANVQGLGRRMHTKVGRRIGHSESKVVEYCHAGVVAMVETDGPHKAMERV